MIVEFLFIVEFEMVDGGSGSGISLESENWNPNLKLP
jgi:hypothetical protein